jgi:hypothetical protein
MEREDVFQAGKENGMDFTLALVFMLISFGAFSGCMCYPGSCISLMLGVALGIVASFYIVHLICHIYCCRCERCHGIYRRPRCQNQY